MVTILASVVLAEEVALTYCLAGWSLGPGRSDDKCDRKAALDQSKWRFWESRLA